MVDISTGGIRDRLIRDAAATLIKNALAALHWLDSDNPKKLTWLDKPLGVDVEVPLGTITLSAENVIVGDAGDYELGSDLSEDRHVFYVDLYGYDEESARQVVGDVRDILRGKHPSIGCEFAILDVFDTTQDPVPGTPAFQMIIEKVEDDRVRDTAKVFQQFWFLVKFDLVEER